MVVRAILLIMLLVCAVIDDVRRFKISNQLICAGTGAATAAVMMQAFRMDDFSCVLDMLIGGVEGFTAAFIVYALKGIGAGDVKLAMVCGLLLGGQYTPRMLIYSAVCVVFIGTAELLLTKCKRIKLAGIKMHVVHASLGIAIGNVLVLVKIFT